MTAHPKSKGLEFSCSCFNVAFLNRKGVEVRGVLRLSNQDQKLSSNIIAVF